MTNFNLTLDYALAAGWQKPWLDALAEGQALSRCCSACSRTSFIPLRVCDCGATAATWVQLAGTADVVQRTTGQDGDFALVKFSGADTLTTVRLIDMPLAAKTGRLLKPPTLQPVLLLGGQ